MGCFLKSIAAPDFIRVAIFILFPFLANNSCKRSQLCLWFVWRHQAEQLSMRLMPSPKLPQRMEQKLCRRRPAGAAVSVKAMAAAGETNDCWCKLSIGHRLERALDIPFPACVWDSFVDLFHTLQGAKNNADKKPVSQTIGKKCKTNLTKFSKFKRNHELVST